MGLDRKCALLDQVTDVIDVGPLVVQAFDATGHRLPNGVTINRKARSSRASARSVRNAVAIPVRLSSRCPRREPLHGCRRRVYGGRDEPPRLRRRDPAHPLGVVGCLRDHPAHAPRAGTATHLALRADLALGRVGSRRPSHQGARPPRDVPQLLRAALDPRTAHRLGGRPDRRLRAAPLGRRLRSWRA